MLQWHPRYTAMLVILVLVAIALAAGSVEFGDDWANNFNW
jgi:hypothetical protein